MTQTPTVQQLWRYPVKSMQGERLDVAEVTVGGVLHDRGWAVRDERNQTIRGAKHIPALMLCSARYIPDTWAGLVPHVEITLPDGKTVRSDDESVHEALSDTLGKPVTLWSLRPADDVEHYKIGDAEQAKDPAGEWRRLFMLEDGEAMPDIRDFGPDLLRQILKYAAPLGTYYDVFPLNVLTTASIRHLQALTPGSNLDVRRFRPNVLIDTGEDDALVEDGWLGQGLTAGSAVLDVRSRAPRCVMTSHPQPGLERDTGVIRTIAKDLGSCLSVYATVRTAGEIRVGDPLAVIEGTPTATAQAAA